MVLHVFIDGASRGNPGDAGIGIAIFKGKELKEEICEYLGKKTNNEAEYYALIKALERVRSLDDPDVSIFSDSQLLVKQLQGEYKVKVENIKQLYDKAQELAQGLSLKFYWIPREDNAKADALANKGIDSKKTQDYTKKSLFDKAFFGKVSCIRVQMSLEKEVYVHAGLLNSDSKQWTWDVVKFSDIELGEMIALLSQKEGKCAFYHKYGDSTKQIWCNKSEKGFSIKIGDISKSFSIGESEVLKIVFDECIRRRI
jgi:ribonuclease HI